MQTFQSTPEGLLIPNEVVENLLSRDLSMTATKYYILIQPKNMTQLTKGLLKKPEFPFDLNTEIHRSYEER